MFQRWCGRTAGMGCDSHAPVGCFCFPSGRSQRPTLHRSRALGLGLGGLWVQRKMWEKVSASRAWICSSVFCLFRHGFQGIFPIFTEFTKNGKDNKKSKCRTPLPHAIAMDTHGDKLYFLQYLLFLRCASIGIVLGSTARR